MKKYLAIIIIISFVLIDVDVNCYAGDNSDYDPTTLVFPAFLHTYGIRKATPFHLFLFTRNKVKFKNPQGLAVVRLLSWDDSTTTNDDDEVTVYGVNSGQDCIIYNTSMTSIGIYGLGEQDERKLNCPTGIAANETGVVYVADSGNHRIVKLFNPGHKLAYQKSVGELGTKPGQFNLPHDVALDSQGNVYVTDYGNHRIQQFSANLTFVRQWGRRGKGRGQLFFPTGLAVADKKQRWTFYKENFLIVIDSSNARLQQFDLKGKLIRGIAASQFGFPDTHLSYVALDYYNNIYVTDTRNHCIHKFDHRLNYLTSYGKYGKGKKEFIEPRGITIYRKFGQVFVAEKWGAQYYWIGTDCFDFRIQSSADNKVHSFHYFLTEPAFVTTDILDTKYQLITRLWTKRFKNSGSKSDVWYGQIKPVADSVLVNEQVSLSPAYTSLKVIPAGEYIVRYKIEPTYSSYHYFEKMVEKKLKIN